VACLLGQYEISLHTAKIVTLGERVEDVFRISGDALANPKTVLQLEQALLGFLQP
jgi:[protein-PII] uridylyltransferase